MSVDRADSTSRLFGALLLLAVLNGCTSATPLSPAASRVSAADRAASPATAASPASSASAAVPPVALTVNYAALGSGHSGAWLAHEGGYFREQGLDVPLTYIPSTPTVLQAMVAGQVQLSGID